MNAYRIALILCRAVTIGLWWSAGLSVVTMLTLGIAIPLGLMPGFVGTPLQLILNQAMVLVPQIVVAGFLSAFAPALCAGMSGGATLEGETISSRQKLEHPEILLAGAGAGLFLLAFGAVSLIPGVLRLGYLLLFERPSVGLAGPSLVFYAVSGLLLPALQCVAGFYLTFRLGLRRLVKPDQPEPQA